jgi:hypothetical protein
MVEIRLSWQVVAMQVMKDWYVVLPSGSNNGSISYKHKKRLQALKMAISSNEVCICRFLVGSHCSLILIPVSNRPVNNGFV